MEQTYYVVVQFTVCTDLLGFCVLLQILFEHLLSSSELKVASCLIGDWGERLINIHGDTPQGYLQGERLLCCNLIKSTR